MSSSGLGATGTWGQTWLDLVRWPSETGDPERYQIVMPLTAGSSTAASATTAVTPQDEFNETLWAAQTVAINAQTERLRYIGDELGDYAAGGKGIRGVVKDLSAWFLTRAVKEALAEYIEKQTVILDMLGEIGDDIADWIADGTVSAILWLHEFLEKSASPQYQACMAMVEENNAMLTLTRSTTNYQIRRDLLEQHQTAILQWEKQLQEASGAVFEIIKFISDLIKTWFSGDTDNNEDWVEAFDDLEDSISEVDEWVKDVYEADAGDLPVPAPPPLPTLPDKGKGQPTKAIVFLVAKLAIKLFMEYLRRHREHDPDAGEALDKAFFFTDPADGQKKSIFDRGLLKHYPTEVLALLEVLDQDVALRDATIDFGTFRITIKGKTIQYG